MTYHEKKAEFGDLNGLSLFMLTMAERLEADASPASVARVVDSLRARGIDARDRATAALKQLSDMKKELT